MPGTSAAHTVWFIAAVLTAAGLAGALIGITFSITKGLDSKSQQIQGQLTSKIEIINDPMRVPYDDATDTATFYVSNQGYSMLNSNKSSILVLINGVSSGQPLSVTIYSGASLWKNGEIAVIQVSADLLPNTDYSIWISASDAASGAAATDSMDFKIIDA